MEASDADYVHLYGEGKAEELANLPKLLDRRKSVQKAEFEINVNNGSTNERRVYQP